MLHDIIRNPDATVSHKRINYVNIYENASLDYEGAPAEYEDHADYYGSRDSWRRTDVIRGVRLA